MMTSIMVIAIIFSIIIIVAVRIIKARSMAIKINSNIIDNDKKRLKHVDEENNIGVSNDIRSESKDSQ